MEILQQGYNPGTKTCVTQTSEPLLLDVWNTPYAIGPADHALFLTISPDWQKNLFTCIDGQNIQEVAVQRRTVPGPKAPERSAIYPGVSVFMYPRELPAGRPGY